MYVEVLLRKKILKRVNKKVTKNQGTISFIQHFFSPIKQLD
jgi:hypothetical protein